MLLMSEEGLTETKHDKIHVAKPCDINMTRIKEKLAVLRKLVDTNDNENKDEIKKVIHEVVPTYREPNKNKK